MQDKLEDLMEVPLGWSCYFGTVANIIQFHTNHMRSTNKVMRVATSSLSAEIQEACETDDVSFPARLLLSEITVIRRWNNTSQMS